MANDETNDDETTQSPLSCSKTQLSSSQQVSDKTKPEPEEEMLDQTKTRCCFPWWRSLFDADRFEVSLRVTLASFLSYVLATAHLPNAIPTRTGYLVGVVGPILAFAMPTLLMGIGAVIPGFVFALFFGLASATMLLAVSIAGNGALVTIFALWALLMSSLYFGPDSKSTIFTGSFAIAVTVLIGCSFFQFVQHGVILEAPWEYLVEYCSSIARGKEGDAYVGILCQVLELHGGGRPEDGQVQVELTTGIFAGHYATIEPSSNDDSSVTISIAGGLWVVRSLWTWTGVTNPLAAIQNFIIVWAWGILCAMLSPLLPPFRTVRRVITQSILPGALQGATAALLAATEVQPDNSSNRDVVNHRDYSSGSINDGNETRATKPRLDHLIHAAHLLMGNKLASMTAFEPRLWHPLECTWPTLLCLDQSVRRVVMAALAVDALPNRIACECNFQNSIDLLTRCKDALQTSGSMPNHNKVLFDDGETPVFTEPEDDSVGGEEYICRRMHQIAHEAAVASDAWIAALNGSGDPSPSVCSQAAWNNVVTNMLPWFYPIFAFAKRLSETICSPFRVQSWRDMFLAPFPGLVKVAWCAKFAGGMTVLFAMTVYWSNYRTFEIPTTNKDPVTLEEINMLNPPPQDYSGWHLLAYVFATTPTLEGSVKKGFLRLAGTVLGAFSAWLAITATGGNVYGLVAWLTIVTFGAANFSYDRGLPARLGLSENHGYGGFYFVLTQSLVALEVFAAKSDLNKYVVNRIVANITGIFMAVILSLVPPTIHGGNPVHAQALLSREKKALADCLRLLLSGDAAGLDEQRAEYLDEAISLHSVALNLYKDASRLNGFPFWRTDPTLLSELEALTVTGSLVNSLFMHASDMVKDQDTMAAFLDGTWLHKEVKLALAAMNPTNTEECNDAVEEGQATEECEESSDFHPHTRPEVFLILVRMSMKQMQDHASVLSSVKWGFSSQKKG